MSGTGRLQRKIENNFTTVHNDFIKDTRLGLEEIGMLLKLMSLPDNWNFSIMGLTKIVNAGKHKVSATLKNLEKYGYFRRTRITDEKTGRIVDWLYEFSDQVQEEWLNIDNDKSDSGKEEIEVSVSEDEESPHSDLPHLDEPHLENEPQLNTNKENTNIFIDRYDVAELKEKISEQINEENILVVDNYATEQEVESFVALIADVQLSSAPTLSVNGEKISTDRVKEQFNKLTYEHIQYVLKCIKESKSKIKNMRNYLLTSLYNAVTTYESYVAADAARIFNL